MFIRLLDLMILAILQQEWNPNGWIVHIAKMQILQDILVFEA
jgi:hypothetical protein